MGEKKSLTEWPDNLKDVVDWFLRVGGKDNISTTDKSEALKNAVFQLEGHQAVKSALGNGDLPGLFRKVAEALQGFIGYDKNGQQPLDGNGIANKGGYISSYDKATWNGELDQPESQEAKKAAHIFLGSMPILYFGLTYLYWNCSSRQSEYWASDNLNGYNSALSIFISTMGYTPTSMLHNIQGSEVAERLTKNQIYGFDELKEAKTEPYSYSDFLEKVKQYGEQKLTSSPVNCSLYTLYRASKAYLASKFKEGETSEETFDTIKQKLDKFSKSCWPSYTDLKSEFDNFLKEIGASQTPPSTAVRDPSPSPSPAAPVAGTLTTLGLGGGATAAYLLDLGGAKTLVNDSPLSTLADFSYRVARELKRCIDWFLRVTGKDGGTGGDKSEALAKALLKLPDFQRAIKAAAEKVKGDGVHVSQALENLKSEITLKGIIEKLGDSLRAFIGYDGKGQRIALVIDPLQQLRKGVLEFLRGFLDRLKSDLAVEDNDATTQLRRAVGSGKESFEKAIGMLAVITQDTSVSRHKIPGILKALKNVDVFKNEKDVGGLASGFKEYLAEVLGAVARNKELKSQAAQAATQVDNLKEKLTSLVNAYGNQKGDLTTETKDVREAERTLTYNAQLHPVKSLVEGVKRGTTSFLQPLQHKSRYKSAYMVHNWKGTTDNNKIAKIFLGCLPLYYYWLTYLYWKCSLSHSQGGWEGNRPNSGSLSAFMVGHGYVTVHLNKHPGKNIAPLLERFDELKDSMQTASGTPPTTTKPSHPELLGALNKSLQEAIGTGSSSSTTLNGHSLSALFQLCRCYFTGKHIIQSGSPTFKPRPPTSIREMLYWLAGLQFSPHYSDLTKHIDNVIPAQHGLPVADSSTSSPDNVITQSQMKGFLLSSCLSAPGVLGAIQGDAADSKEPDGEPWLYSLFCNSMNLRYPSGPALFNTLASYSYALQFQLYFLYRQCQNNYSYTCGWKQCAFGKNVNARIQGSIVVSYICPTGCTKGSHDHSTRPDQCEHTGCGESTKGSPLQAFLTDNLKGFCRQHPGTSTHLTECSLGSLCHVPMGFNPMDLRTASNASTQGENICLTLRAFCGGFNTPLRQLSEKLGCLTKRTPRVLGDLFGFTWHLNGQLFKDRPTPKSLAAMLVKAMGSNNPPTVPGFLFNILKVKASPLSTSSPSPTGLSRSLEAMAPTIPFLYQLFMAEDSNSLPGTLFDLNQHCHTKENKSDAIVNKKPNQRLTVVTHNGDVCSTANDLWSLYQPVGQKPSPPDDTDPYKDCRNGNCGPYLYPLTHSDGATFGKPAPYASTYLSWMVYLTDDLQSWFQDMLDEFKDIDCKALGCIGKSQCNHSAGQHGTPAACSCPSVVQCGGTLPLLYRHGFRYFNPAVLMGWKVDGSRWKQDDDLKGKCSHFASQLNNLLQTNSPLDNLITTIDDFLYAIRWEFFSKLSSFWTIYICLILYTFFFLLDTLRVRSHVKLTPSTTVPPLSLLTSGKPPPITKLTYITQ
ncbi:extracellular matrix-binding ebh [Babesia caballi]|uniref:Extracellular matrix-binding ebh n=1 Tax=Babesia caballi TaxID=5871 RepID=A0AAV4LP65_BABCB|nr:extracellular matrix-binding ebh [Babesia caballi]